MITRTPKPRPYFSDKRGGNKNMMTRIKFMKPWEFEAVKLACAHLMRSGLCRSCNPLKECCYETCPIVEKSKCKSSTSN